MPLSEEGPRTPRVGEILFFRLPGSFDDHWYPAIVVRTAPLSLAVLVDSRARSAAALGGPVVTVEEAESFDPAQPWSGGWCFAPRIA